MSQSKAFPVLLVELRAVSTEQLGYTERALYQPSEHKAFPPEAFIQPQWGKHRGGAPVADL